MNPTVAPVPPTRGQARPDRPLLLLLFLLNLGSAATTVLGARQVLPSPLAEVLGLTVQSMLFLLLAGWTARHAPVRRWFVVGVFAAFSVYTSFFTYHRTLAGEVLASESFDRAATAHASFVSALWQPALTERDRLLTEATQRDALVAAESERGVTTGEVGYGPQAREYARQARELRAQSELLATDLLRVEPHIVEAKGRQAEEIYEADLLAWQLAPDDWKAGVPQPERADYVDPRGEVGLLTPIHLVRAGDLPAMVALLLALLVDGVAILLGTAITASPAGPGLGQRAAGVVEQAKDELAVVQAAWQRPGVALPRRHRWQAATTAEPASVEAGGEEPAVLLLRLEGRTSDFLGALYEAIHPETGEVDLPSLLTHHNPSWRVAARLLADRLRHPAVGWLVVRDGWWCVPPGRYDALTSWLAVELRRALEEEQARPAGAQAEVVSLRLPRAA